MKHVVRALAALAVLGLASPSLACDGAKQTTTAEAKAAKPAPKVVKAEAKPKAKAAPTTAQAPATQAAAQN